MAAVAAILDHKTKKIGLCAILNPLKQPEAKTIGISTSCIFPKSKMATGGHFVSDCPKNEQSFAPYTSDDPCKISRHWHKKFVSYSRKLIAIELRS